MAVRTGNTAVSKAIATIDETAWVDIDYTPDGQAQVAECRYQGRRLVVPGRWLMGRLPLVVVGRIASGARWVRRRAGR